MKKIVMFLLVFFFLITFSFSLVSDDTKFYTYCLDNVITILDLKTDTIVDQFGLNSIFLSETEKIIEITSQPVLSKDIKQILFVADVENKAEGKVKYTTALYRIDIENRTLLMTYVLSKTIDICIEDFMINNQGNKILLKFKNVPNSSEHFRFGVMDVNDNSKINLFGPANLIEQNSKGFFDSSDNIVLWNSARVYKFNFDLDGKISADSLAKFDIDPYNIMKGQQIKSVLPCGDKILVVYNGNQIELIDKDMNKKSYNLGYPDDLKMTISNNNRYLCVLDGNANYYGQMILHILDIENGQEIMNYGIGDKVKNKNIQFRDRLSDFFFINEDNDILLSFSLYGNYTSEFGYLIIPFSDFTKLENLNLVGKDGYDIASIDFSNDGNYLLAKTIKDSNSKPMYYTLRNVNKPTEKTQEFLLDSRFSSDSKKIFSHSNYPNEFKIFDISKKSSRILTFKNLKEFYGYSDDKKYIFTNIGVINSESEKIVLNDSVRNMKWSLSEDNSTFAFEDQNSHTIIVQNFLTKKLIKQYKLSDLEPIYSLESLSLSHDGKHIILLFGLEHKVIIINNDNGKEIINLKATTMERNSEYKIKEVSALSKNNIYFLIGRNLVDINKYTSMTIPTIRNKLPKIMITKNSKYLIMDSSDYSNILIFDLQSKDVKNIIYAPLSQITSYDYSEANNKLAVGTSLGEIFIYDLSTILLD